MRPSLTKRENQILKLILKEKTSREIGEKLGISRRTVEKIRSKILTKTKSKSAVGLLVWAINNDMVKVNNNKKPKVRV